MDDRVDAAAAQQTTEEGSVSDVAVDPLDPNGRNRGARAVPGDVQPQHRGPRFEEFARDPAPQQTGSPCDEYGATGPAAAFVAYRHVTHGADCAAQSPRR